MSEKTNIKTPISHLQELCLKEGWVPKYVLTANEGHDHNPLFIFDVTAGDICATGKGPSKKKAKHNAAVNAVEKLLNLSQIRNPPNPNDKEDLSGKMSEMSLYSEHMEDNKGNPVGELQESTQKVAWNPPKYVFSEAQGPPHDREFICTVHVCNHIEKASGKSKKLAKRNAASLMLEKIKKGLVHNNNPLQDEAQFMLENSKQNFIQSQYQPNPIIHHNEDSTYLQNTHPTETKPQQKKISAMFSSSTKSNKMGKYLSELQEIDFTDITDDEDSTNLYELYGHSVDNAYTSTHNKNTASYACGNGDHLKSNKNNTNNNNNEIENENKQTSESCEKIFTNKILDYVNPNTNNIRFSQQIPLEKYWTEANKKNTKETKIKNQLKSKNANNSNKGNDQATNQPSQKEENLQSNKISKKKSQETSKTDKKCDRKQTSNEVVDDVSGHHYDSMMDMLDNLSKEQAFEYIFYDLPFSSTEGCFQSIIHLFTTPPQTAHGSGKSKYEARKKACYDVLKRLKILTKRPS